MAMVDGDLIDSPDLPASMRSDCISSEAGLNRTLVQVEMEYIRHVLDSVAGNKTKAARILDIDRKTLREKLKRGGVDAGSEQE